jgi:hypothetical protein
MAIINNSFKFIFVHIPKTAGTSVTSVLSRYTNYCDLEIGGTEFGERIQPAYQRRFGVAKHSTANALRNLVGPVTWSKYFSFAFVRNPFSRCLSTFHFLRKWEGAGEEFAKKMRSFSSFEEYVLSDLWEESNGPDDIFRPQVHWLRARPKAQELLVDSVGFVEKIEEDLARIVNVIDPGRGQLRVSAVPKLNRSGAAPTADIHDDRVLEKIVTHYRDDFDAFAYSTDYADPLSVQEASTGARQV